MNFKHLESKDKLRGGFYTPAEIAELLSRWVLDSGARRILEPGCGDGVFFRAIANLLTAEHSPEAIEVCGIEIDPAEAAKALVSATELEQEGVKVEIRKGDFFSWIQSVPLSETWDAVVGNPPYIRYQYFDADQREIAEKLFVEAGVPFTKRTNAWVPFVIGCLLHLAPGGMLAMVLPAELLHILHAEGLRHLMEQEMESIELLDIRQLAFKGVLQGVVLVKGIRKSDRSFAPLSRQHGRSATQLRLEGGRELKQEPPASLNIRHLESAERYEPLEASKQRNVLANGSFKSKWTRGLLEDDELSLLAKIERQAWAVPFSAIADPDIGIVTGANSYFVVDLKTAETYDLKGISAPMLARSEFIRGITYTEGDQQENVDSGKRVLFLGFPPLPKSDLPEGMASYIELGESKGLHKRYKCRIRDPWYVVPYVWVSDLAMLKRCHEYPRMVLNQAKALSTDTAYRITLRDEYAGRERDLVFSFLNSLTLLCAELEGRHYAGGVLELVPSEIERLLVPLIRMNGSHLDEVDQLIREQRPLEDLLSVTDPLILGPGSPADLSAKELEVLRQARNRLAARRKREV